jgi:hypothetical protein
MGGTKKESRVKAEAETKAEEERQKMQDIRRKLKAQILKENVKNDE